MSFCLKNGREGSGVLTGGFFVGSQAGAWARVGESSLIPKTREVVASKPNMIERQNTTGENEYSDFNLFMFYLLSIATRAVRGGSHLVEK
jgi:hypothetical protein